MSLKVHRVWVPRTTDYNLERMVEMQDEVLERRKGTFTHLYRGLVLPEYVVDGGPGSPNQLPKFYVLVPILPTVEGLDHNEVDALFRHCPIRLGCKVDLTKFGRQLLQRWEHSVCSTWSCRGGEEV